MAEKIVLTCRVQYLRGKKWVTIGDNFELESNLTKEIERLRTLALEILANYKEDEAVLEQEFATAKGDWDAAWKQIAEWEKELQNPHGAEKEG